jgi:calcineurin-like phosphoesterase family protein
MTDTHLWPWNIRRFLNVIFDQRPKFVFHTGDFSNASFMTLRMLDYIGSKIGRPYYFVLGNHSFHLSSIEATHAGIRALCKKHPNLIWLDDIDFAPLNEEACVLGTMGWYDARVGNSDYLKYTFDWFLTKEFRDLPNMDARIEMFRGMAETSTNTIISKLEKVIDNYKTIYLLVHVPPFHEAHRADSWLSYKFYEPYNTNFVMGKRLVEFMAEHKKRHLIVLAGHVHMSQTCFASRNVECRVGRGSYSSISDEEVLYI